MRNGLRETMANINLTIHLVLFVETAWCDNIKYKRKPISNKVVFTRT
jgi:hypothetical protein